MSTLWRSWRGTLRSIKAKPFRAFRLIFGNAALGLNIEDKSLFTPRVVFADTRGTNPSVALGTRRRPSADAVIPVPYKAFWTLGRPCWNTGMGCTTVPMFLGALRRPDRNTLSVANHTALRTGWESGQGAVFIEIVGTRLANGDIRVLADAVIEDRVGRTLGLFLMDAVISFLPLTLRAGGLIQRNTLIANKPGSIRARRSLNKYAFLAVELTSSGASWITQDTLPFVVASDGAPRHGSLDTSSIDGVIEIRARRALRGMATITFLVLGTVRAFRLSDFPRAECSIKVVGTLLATTLSARRGSKDFVSRAAVKLCNICAGVSNCIVGVAVRARGIRLADTILEDSRRTNRVIFPDTDPCIKLVLLRAFRRQNAVAAIKPGFARTYRGNNSGAFPALRLSSLRATGRIFADT